MICTRDIVAHARLIATVATLALLCGLTASTPSTATAQEVQITGPLAGAPAVHDLRVWRKGRVQVQPFFAFMLRPEFSRSLLFGVQAKYNFLDWLGVGAWGAFSFAQTSTSLTNEIKANGETRPPNRLNLPSREGFGAQIGKIKWLTGIEANFIPLRGKLSLFQKIFVDTDLQLLAGVAFIGVTERADTAAGVCDSPSAACLATQSARSSRTAIAPSFGVGINAHFARFMGVSIQWRALPFKWNTSGWDTSGNGSFPDGTVDSKDRGRHFNQMLTIGYVLYFPPKIKVQH